MMARKDKIVIPSMIEEHARRSQLLKNVPKEVIVQGLSQRLFGRFSWEKNDLDRIVGVELREDNKCTALKAGE